MSSIRLWFGLFRDYAAARVFSQGLSVAAGLLLVNLMPVREYALFTIVLSGLTFVSTFSDLGVGNALLFFRRKTEQANIAMAPYWVAAIRLRTAFLTIASVGAIWFLISRGSAQGFSAGELICVTPLVPVTCWFILGGTIFSLQLRLDGRYRFSYVADIVGQASRFLIVGLGGFFSVLTAWLGLVAAALGALATASLSRRWAARTTDLNTGHPPESPANLPYGELLRYLRPNIPSAAYFSIQAPLMVWLIAFFGETENIAQVGALGRLALILGLITDFFNTVALPRLSAIIDDKRYLTNYLSWLLLYFAFGMVLIGAAGGFPWTMLWLLGNQYASLESEVVLVAISAVFSTWGGLAVSINSARGWVRWQPLALGFYAAAQITLILVLDLSTTPGVILFGMASAAIGLFLQIAINFMGFYNPRLVAVRLREAE